MSEGGIKLVSAVGAVLLGVVAALCNAPCKSEEPQPIPRAADAKKQSFEAARNIVLVKINDGIKQGHTQIEFYANWEDETWVEVYDTLTNIGYTVKKTNLKADGWLPNTYLVTVKWGKPK
jgi:hypothetical protein